MEIVLGIFRIEVSISNSLIEPLKAYLVQGNLLIDTG